MGIGNLSRDGTSSRVEVVQVSGDRCTAKSEGKGLVTFVFSKDLSACEQRAEGERLQQKWHRGE
jgi:hypothetical protein